MFSAQPKVHQSSKKQRLYPSNNHTSTNFTSQAEETGQRLLTIEPYKETLEILEDGEDDQKLDVYYHSTQVDYQQNCEVSEMGVQVISKDLFDFEMEVRPLVEILQSKIIVDSRSELIEEDERTIKRKTQMIHSRKKQRTIQEIQRRQNKIGRKVVENQRLNYQVMAQNKVDQELQKKIYLNDFFKSQTYYCKQMAIAGLLQVQDKQFSQQELIRQNYLPFIFDQVEDFHKQHQLTIKYNRELVIEMKNCSNNTHKQSLENRKLQLLQQEQDKLDKIKEEEQRLIQMKIKQDKEIMKEKIQNLHLQFGIELGKRNTKINNIFQFQINDLYNQHYDRDQQINLPGGFTLQLWIMIDSIDKIDNIKQKNKFKKEQDKINDNINEYQNQRDQLLSDQQELKQKGLKQDEVQLQTIKLLNSKLQSMNKQLSEMTYKFKRNLDETKITELIIDIFNKLIKLPLTIIFSDEFYQQIQSLFDKMENTFTVFQVKKDKIIANMCSQENLKIMFSQKSLLYQQINSPIYDLDEKFIGWIMKVIFLIYFRKLQDGQSINELSYTEQNWFLAQYKLAFSSDGKEEEVFQEKDKKEQEIQKRRAARIIQQQISQSQIEQDDKQESMIEKSQYQNNGEGNEQSINMSNSVLNLTMANDSYYQVEDSQQKQQNIRKVIIRYNTMLKYDIKMLLTPEQNTDLSKTVDFDGLTPEYLFIRHPHIFYQQFSDVSAVMFRKNQFIQKFDHLIFNQNLIYLFRMNLYNFMIKQKVIFELNKRQTKILNRYFFEQDRIFRQAIDKNLKKQIPGAFIFDYYSNNKYNVSQSQLEQSNFQNDEAEEQEEQGEQGENSGNMEQDQQE